MDEQVRLLTLAHLKNGKKPADAAEITGISYASAIKLRKELHNAEERNRILELFKLDEAALEILLESVEKQLVPAIEAFDIGERVEEEVDSIRQGVQGGKLLNKELQDAASALATRITSVALTSTNAETILSLSKAICELQNAFFGQDKAANPHLPLTSFEQHLRN